MVDQLLRPEVLESRYQSAVALHTQALRHRIGAKARLRRFTDAPYEKLLDLTSACDCVATEWGFDDWESMCRETAAPPADPHQAARWFALQLLNGEIDDINVSDALSSLSSSDSLGVRLAMMDQTVSIEEIDASGVDNPLTPIDVPALVYICCSKYGASNATVRARRRAWADQLLRYSANPNVGMPERDSIRGFRTCLGGAIGLARDVELAQRLLDAGADINDGPTLYEGSAMWEAVRSRDHVALDLLINADPPEWHVCHALTHCLQFHDPELVEKLLAAGADPNWDKTVFGMDGNALHEAIQCDVPLATIEMLIEHGTNIDGTDGGDRTPLAIATALGRNDIVNVLAANGAESKEIDDFERFVGACFREIESEAQEIRESAEIREAKSYHDQLWLHEAIKRGSHETLDLLLEVNFDLGTIDYQGETALHRAVITRDEHAIEKLLERGAPTSALNFDGDTVVEVALRSTSPVNSHIVDKFAHLLTEEQFNARGSRLRALDIESFEFAADAIANGNAQVLRDLLEANPYFNQARSTRPHRCALMNYIGVNGFEGERQKSPENAVEIIDMLLAHGCDPNVVCYTYRGGPGQNPLGLLLSSGVVSSAEQQMAMVRALVNGGATIGAGYRLLFELLDGNETDTVDEVIRSIDMNDSAVREAFFGLGNSHEFSVMEKLIDAGFDVNVTNELEQTALHWAALNGDETFVDWLLEHDADPTLRELQFDGTCAGWADAGGHAELAKRLGRLVSDAT